MSVSAGAKNPAAAGTNQYTGLDWRTALKNALQASKSMSDKGYLALDAFVQSLQVSDIPAVLAGLKDLPSNQNTSFATCC